MTESMGPGDRTSVLVVDDDETFVRSMLRGFHHHGLEVHGATTAAQARELAALHRPHILLVDLRLGADSGLELVAQLRAANAGAAIVLLSAYASVAATVAALRAGADLVLFKPVMPGDILRQIAGDPCASAPEVTTPSLARAEWEHVNRVLFDCNGNVTAAARRLGIHRQSLQRKLRKHPPQP
jgi:two-component system, response regulator RegA